MTFKRSTVIRAALVFALALSFAPVFPLRFDCADPPYDTEFLAKVSRAWDREGFVHVMALDYPLVVWWQMMAAQFDGAVLNPSFFAEKIAIGAVEWHAKSEVSAYIRAAPEDVARLLALYREIGTDRRCEPTIIGMKGDLPAAAWAELRALPEWPE